MSGANRQSIVISLILGLVAFGLDRGHKFYQVSSACIDWGLGRCPSGVSMFVPNGWAGGEYVRVTDFFDYVLAWNTGISYGLLASLPVWALGLIMAAAITALAIWWARAGTTLVRSALMLIIGGALSNALDRWLYGAVADFFHLHWGDYSFYIFNLADAAISLGVVLLVLDMLGFGRQKPA